MSLIVKILFLFFSFVNIAFSLQGYAYINTSYSLNAHLPISADEQLLIGDGDAFLIHNMEDDLFSEHFIPGKMRPLDVVKVGNQYYVLIFGSLLIYEKEIISPIKRINLSQTILNILDNSEEFLDLLDVNDRIFRYNMDTWENNEIIISNNKGKIYKHSHSGYTIFESKGEVFKYTIEFGFEKLFEINELELIKRFYYYNNNYHIWTDSRYYRFNDEYELEETYLEATDFHTFDGEILYKGIVQNDMKIELIKHEKSGNQNKEFLDSGVDSLLNVRLLGGMYSYKDKSYLIGDRKLIVKYEREKNNFELLSAFLQNLASGSGMAGFYDKDLGYYSSFFNFIFITTNGGATWRYLEKDEKLKNNKYNAMSSGLFFEDGSLIVETAMILDNYDDVYLANPRESLDYEWKNLMIARGNVLSDRPKYLNGSIYTHFSNSPEDSTGKRVNGHRFYKHDLINDTTHMIQLIDNSFFKYNKFKDSFFSRSSSSSEELLYRRKWSIAKLDYNFENYINISHPTDYVIRFNHELAIEKYLYLIGMKFEIIDDDTVYPYILYRFDTETHEFETVSNLTELGIASVEFLPLDNKNIYLRQENEVLVSYDKGKSFEKYISGIPRNINFMLVPDYFQSFDEIFYFNGGDYDLLKSFPYNTKSISSVEFETESPSTFYTYRPYPNPANNMVTLPFDFMSSLNLANMDIKLIDVSGRDVSQFADFNIRALNHYKAELEIKLDNIQRGIYFIQMTLNGTNKTSSFIKLN